MKRKMRKKKSLCLVEIFLLAVGFATFASATPVYISHNKGVVGGSDYEARLDGTYAEVSGVFYLPPLYGPNGYLASLHWSAGPEDYVGIELYPLYPQWEDDPNAVIYGPGAYAEVEVITDITVPPLIAEIDEYGAIGATVGKIPV